MKCVNHTFHDAGMMNWLLAVVVVLSVSLSLATATDSDTQLLLDRFAIQDLLHSYAFAVDDRHWDVYMSLFEPNATIDYRATGGKLCAGPAEGVAFLQVPLDLLFGRTVHAVMNLMVDFTGKDSAVLNAYLDNPNSFLGLSTGPFFTIFARYRFEVVRSAPLTSHHRGWRFRHLSMSLFFGNTYAMVALLVALPIGAVIWWFRRRAAATKTKKN